MFTFTIYNVPPGRGFYAIEVSHRGRVQFTEQQLRTGTAALSLG